MYVNYVNGVTVVENRVLAISVSRLKFIELLSDHAKVKVAIDDYDFVLKP